MQTKVMTYNIRHGKGMDGKVDLSRIAEQIRISDADIIALQEVDRYHVRSGFRDQVRWLAEKLGMDWCFSLSMRYGLAQYGNAVLSRYPILRCRSYLLPGILERRSLLRADVLYGGREVTVYNTHLGVLKEERDMQLPLIRAILDRTEGPGILMGDFNTEGPQPLLDGLLKAWNKIRMKIKSATVFGGREIDHIFVNEAPVAADAWTLKSEASDHHPVVAQWIWAARGRGALA